MSSDEMGSAMLERVSLFHLFASKPLPPNTSDGFCWTYIPGSLMFVYERTSKIQFLGL
jgi:hypothetical protein